MRGLASRLMWAWVMPDFRFPSTSQHTTILGRTGSGKTQMGAWLLSHAPFEYMPYIIVDYKGDDLLNSIGATPWAITADPPEERGLYIVHPLPQQLEQLDAFLWKIHRKGNTGLYFDEGFMVAKLPSLEAILMQGRSKHIPCFILSQRPAWISRYAFSEASHFVVFHLNDRRDQQKVLEFFDGYNEERQPKYWSQWYDVNQDANFILQPVPHADIIRQRFINKLDEIRRQKNKKEFI